MEEAALQDEQPRNWRGYLLPAGIGLVPLAAAFLGALASESGGGVVSGVEGVQSSATTFLDNFGTSLQLGFAFVAGMVSTVNPCGFPMLPAYLGLYLSSEEAEQTERDRPEQTERDQRRGSTLRGLVTVLRTRRLPEGTLKWSTLRGFIVQSSVSLWKMTLRLARSGLRGIMVGGVVASGIVALFVTVGLIISGGAQVVIDAMPWIGLVIGILLTFAGAWMLSGGKIYTALAGQAAAGIGDPTRVSVRGYFLFGLSYGLASLSCTLPIFLAVTGLSVASKGFAESAGQFLVYALGMGSVIVLLTLAISVFKGAMVGLLRAALPYIQPVSAVLMLAAGAYIVFYWLTLGDLIDKLT